MNGKTKGTAQGGSNLRRSSLPCPRCDIWVKVIRKGDGREVNGVQIAIDGPTVRKDQKTKDKGRAEFDRVAPGDYDVSATLSGALRKYFLDDPQAQKCHATPGGVAYAEFIVEPHWVKIAIVEDKTKAAVVGADVAIKYSDGEDTPKTGGEGIAEVRYMREGACSVESVVADGETWELVTVE